MELKLKGVRKLWERYKFAALVALIGAALLLWPGSGKTENAEETAETVSDTPSDTADIQRELEEILGKISGVGEVRVMLTVESEGTVRLAQDTTVTYSGSAASPESYSNRSETVLTDDGTAETVVVTGRSGPTYRGALVVCQGGDRAEVKLAVTEAVADLTGLSSDRVTVAKYQ